MSAPIIKHGPLIQAALDGKTILWRPSSRTSWQELTGTVAIQAMVTHPEGEAKVKPDSVVLYARVFKTQSDTFQQHGVPVLFDAGWSNREQCVKSGKADKILRVEIDTEAWTAHARIEDV